MNGEVLVLNAAYQPVAVVTWQKAMTKLHADKADERVEIVATYPDRTIGTGSGPIPMPSVVRHLKFNYRKTKGIRFSRLNVWARDRGRCQYCGKQVPRGPGMTYDHVIPRSKGGKTEFTNIVTACPPCNGRKGDMTLQQANMRLLRQPVKPDVLPEEFTRRLGFKKWMPEEWKLWLGNNYWHGDPDAEDDT